MINLTHPDILEMQRKGYLGSEPKPVAVCHICRDNIYPDATYYDLGGCILCDEYECIMAWLERYKR